MGHTQLEEAISAKQLIAMVVPGGDSLALMQAAVSFEGIRMLSSNVG